MQNEISGRPEAEISDAEWEVMRIVWAKGAPNARYMIDGLKEKLNWKESTTKTLIRRLVEKGYLEVSQTHGLNCYTANLSEARCSMIMADKLFKRVCSTRHGDFLGDLIRRYELSASDVGHLSEILSEIEPVETIQCNCTPCQCDHCGMHDHTDH